jgi:hypothetical protein
MDPAGDAENTAGSGRIGRGEPAATHEPVVMSLPVTRPVARPAPLAALFLGVAVAGVVLGGGPAVAEVEPGNSGWGGPAGDRSYAVAEAVFLQRSNATRDRPLVVAGSDEEPVIWSRDLRSTVGPGVRLLVGDYGTDGLGWEVGYLGVYGMTSQRQAASDVGDLQAAGDLGIAESGLNDALTASVRGQSSLNSAEANVVFHQFDGGYDRSSPRPAQRCAGYDGGSVDWLLGFRWAGFDDTATLGFSPPGFPAPNTYRVNATSNLFATQVGVRGRMARERWGMEGWMKVGLAGVDQGQSQTFFDQLAPDDPYRSPRVSDRGTVGMISDMNISGIYRLTDTWGVRIGYNLLWLTGVALAPDQFDFSASAEPDAGRRIVGTGSVFLHGANVGLEARW